MFRKVVIHILFPLFIGSLIYFLFRDKNLLMFQWVDNSIFRTLQNYIGLGERWGMYIPDWIIYSLPDGLWAYSLSYSLFTIWRNSKHHIPLFILISLIAVSAEFLQLYSIIPGTFCIIDITLIIVAVITACIAVNYKIFVRRIKNEEFET